MQLLACVGDDGRWRGRHVAQDIFLLDVTQYEPLEACRRLRQVLPEVKIVAVAVAEIDQQIFACAEAGVSGYVSCSGSVKDIVTAVHRAIRGELLCSPRTAALLFTQLEEVAPTAASGGIPPGSGALPCNISY